MTNIRLPIERYVDLEILNHYDEAIARGESADDVMRGIYARGRDNARTPMQWDAGAHAGFTTGEPWLPVNENHVTINAAAQVDDPNSVFSYYKALIALRKQYPVFRDGGFTLLCPEDARVFAYTRDTQEAHMLVACNFTGEETDFAVPDAFAHAKTLIANYADAKAGRLRPYEARMLYVQ